MLGHGGYKIKLHYRVTHDKNNLTLQFILIKTEIYDMRIDLKHNTDIAGIITFVFKTQRLKY